MAFRYFSLCLLILFLGASPSFAGEVPSSAPPVYRNALPGQPRPAVIFLHGGRGKGDAMRRYVRIDEALGARGVVAVYPTGQNNHWNDSRGVGSKRDDVSYLDDMIGDMVARGIADPNRLYLAGISNGGMMALRMLCSSRYQFFGAAVVMASQPETLLCKTPKATPLIFMHGSEDRFIRDEGGEIPRVEGPGVLSRSKTLSFWAQANGCRPEMLKSTRISGSGSSGSGAVVQVFGGCQRPMVAYYLKGFGHVWPGARSGPMAERILGPSPDGFSANDVLIQSWFSP